MANRDDMVIRPRLRPERAAAPTRAREEQVMANARGKRGIFRKLIRARAARRLARVRSGRRLQAARTVARGGVARGAAGVAVRGAGRAALFNPVGAIIGVMLVAAAVTLRLASGKSFETLGQQVNQMLIGDMDDEARASMAASRMITGNPNLLELMGREGKANHQVNAIYDDFYRMQLRTERAASAIREDPHFAYNGVFDMLILRAKKAFLAAWNGNGGPDAVEVVRTKLQRIKAGGR